MASQPGRFPGESNEAFEARLKSFELARAQKHPEGSIHLPILGGILAKRKRVIENALSKTVDMREVLKHESVVLSPNVMDEGAIDELIRAFGESGISENDQFNVAIDIARHCSDVGSSQRSTLIGKSPFCELNRFEIAGIIREVTPLRRFCMYYAKIVWNIHLETGIPPANWAQKGFNENEKFAAFDFFLGVTDESALEPKGGVKRAPTKAEMVANIASFEVKVLRQTMAEGKRSSNLGEISGGTAGALINNPFANVTHE
uniref:Capsid protein n=1 Tax=Grapevine rupestris stem pitting-associated virus TaxID=196400 RepID=A0A1B5B747_9VIRU|nr:coat protein [Grapevine rupestris stem pitting-associated virus]